MVYFIWDSMGAIKVGVSDDIPSRLATLRTANPNPLFLLGTSPGGVAKEARIHERFAHLRLEGEWFRAEPELLRYIRATISGADTVGALAPRLTRCPAEIRQWLIDMFSRRREWPSDLFWKELGVGGVSRYGLDQVKGELDIPRPRRRVQTDGTVAYTWYVPPLWPHLREVVL